MSQRRSYLLTFALSALCAGAGVAAAKGPSGAKGTPNSRGGSTKPEMLHGDSNPGTGLGAGAAGDVPQVAVRSRVGEAAETAVDPSAALWIELVDARLAALTKRKRDEVAGGGPPGVATQGQRATAGRSYERLTRRLESVATRFPKHARVGIHVRDLDTGNVIFERHDDLGLNPASNQKLVTAAASLSLLGSDYRFHTKVYLVDDALVIVGEGDPSLQLDDLYELAARTDAALRGRTVNHVIYDDSAFSDERYGPGYREDGDEAYQAPSGALSLNFNTIEVNVRAGAHEGELAEVRLQPESAGVELEVHARTRQGSGQAQALVRTEHRDGKTRVIVEGQLRPRAVSVTRRKITDPGAFTANAFGYVLGRVQGRTPLPATRGQVGTAAELLAVHESETLSTVLGSAMRYSNNFTTEQVLRTLAWRRSGQPGSFASGAQVLESFLAAIGHTDDVHIVNGSGLSTEGRLTPATLVDLLAMARSNDVHTADLLATLATVGGEGTLHSRVHVGRGLVRAKTGTIGTVSALSGVVASPDGSRMLGFSILVNGHDAVATRPAQDAMVAALVGHTNARRGPVAP